MAVDKTDIVDAIGICRETGACVLTLVDAFDWIQELEHLDVLQAKLNSYLAFVESGELLQSYPAAENRSLRTEVVFRCPPPECARQFLAKAESTFATLDVEFTWRVDEPAA